MPKKKQLTQIDKMRVKLKMDKIQQQQNTFIKKEKVFYELIIIYIWIYLLI